MKILLSRIYLIFASTCLVLLTACSDDDDDVVMTPDPPAPVEVSYEVSIANLTEGQLLSPVSIILHKDEQLWQIGQPASEALEKVAESGDNTDLLAQSYVLASTSGEGPIMPGENATLMVSTTDSDATKLSVASMLGNTNDAFTGLNAIDLSSLSVGDSQGFYTFAYDAGTEANTESADTVPGPAAGGTGEGFNSMRDDSRDMVLMHQGVVSMDDGLASSALGQAQRFDNMVARVVITRVE
ncbi:spondin domain-containing protein [Neptunicella sp. SCSIO 80796]|uniref:spondin domain-containing protein n=1 Tax=Neptunicella plasticusilytica TaxID=3117012 RepID=UPI003A4E34F6